MNLPANHQPFIAIACGGTGGHLFPGLAVAGELKQRGCAVALLVSPKDIDRQAVGAAAGMEIFTLPAVGLQDRNYLSFAWSFWNSFTAARKVFQARRPAAVLAMGGFTSAPPILAARKFQAMTFLHDSNTVPGKANRFLARFVSEAFVGFPEAADRLRARKTSVTGTPVRTQFQPREASACRHALGLDPDRPVILVVGGSQGARGLNDLVLSALPLLADKNWQWLHLTGAADFDKVKSAYIALGIKSVVKPFFAEMELALGAAWAAISRSGASSLAEMAAMQLPAVLVPLPSSADNHQWRNAVAYEKTGAALRLDQSKTPPELLVTALTALVGDAAIRSRMQLALAQWHAPKAAEVIAENILAALRRDAGNPATADLRPVTGGEVNLKAIT